MLTTLGDKVLPEHCALLIVDVQNDFAADGGAMHREGRDMSMAQAMVPRLNRLLEAARPPKLASFGSETSTTPVRIGMSEVCAEAGQASTQRRLCRLSGVRTATMERRFLSDWSYAQRGHCHEAPVRSFREF